MLCVAVAQHSVFACGLNWNEPQSHFQGVSFQGYVFQVERLGEVDLGDGLNLPLWAIFRSESNISSPYVGQGWDIPLLESRIVQIDDIWFRMIEPTGWFRLFWRDEKDPTLIHGQGSWKGQIRGNTITTWASCGSKIVFNAGKITQLQVNGRTFDYQYSGNRVSEIREGGRLILKVNGDPSTGIVNGLSYGGQQMGIELGDRPQVQAIQGKNVVASLQKSLGKLTFPDGTTKEYEYAVNEQLQPTLNISGTQKRVIVWNPSSKIIVSDGDWTYDIKQSELPRSHAAIGRVTAKGLSEYWFYNPSKGEETIQGIDGVRRTRTWFVGGKLLGLTRSNVAELNGKVISENRLSRDETGRLIRDHVNINSDEYFTGSYRERTYDSNGKVKTLRRTDGSMSMFDYDKSGYYNYHLFNERKYCQTRKTCKRNGSSIFLCG